MFTKTEGIFHQLYVEATFLLLVFLLKQHSYQHWANRMCNKRFNFELWMFANCLEFERLRLRPWLSKYLCVMTSGKLWKLCAHSKICWLIPDKISHVCMNTNKKIHKHTKYLNCGFKKIEVIFGHKILSIRQEVS